MTKIDHAQFQLATRVDRETARQLRQIAADADTTMTSLIAQGLIHVVERYGKIPSPQLHRIAQKTR
jgi:predicted transcriptional regulator